MIEVGINIEGQDGLNWTRWRRIVDAVESLGFAVLTRSDHYTNAEPPDKDSLELWVSLVWLAANTNRIEFGPLVSPVSFRHPTISARMAKDVDDLSNGRLVLGLGAGWQEREHHNFGLDLLEIPQRFQRFEEALAVITQLLQSDEPIDFQGDFYELHDAVLLPRPQRPGGPPVLVGGNGPKRTLPLVARYADEWNGVFISPQRYAELNDRLDHLLAEQGRAPDEVRRSIMTGVVFGRSDSEVQAKLAGRDRSQLAERGIVVGTANAVVDQLGAFAEAGAERIMLGWADLDDVDGLADLAQAVL